MPVSRSETCHRTSICFCRSNRRRIGRRTGGPFEPNRGAYSSPPLAWGSVAARNCGRAPSSGVIPERFVITSKNAGKIRARVICEGANGPTTAGADSILAEKEIFVIPDILANAGGVTVSYFEWVQDRGGYFWSEESVNDRLTDIMTRSFGDVLKLSVQHKVDMRTAAYMLAISRVATVHRLRGIYA